MEETPSEAPRNPAEFAGSAMRFALSVGIAGVGVLAVISLAGRETETPERSAAVTGIPLPRPPADWPLFPAPLAESPAAAFFIVGTEAARAELLQALAGETVVRIARSEPERMAWVVVAGSDAAASAIAEAVRTDEGLGPGSGALAVEVIDLR